MESNEKIDKYEILMVVLAVISILFVWVITPA